MAPGVGAGVAEGAGLGMGVVEDRVAVGARPDVERRVRLIVRVHLRVQARADGVRREDPVGRKRLGFAFVEGRGCREEGAPPGTEVLFATAVTAVEPDLIPAPVTAGEEVARGQILDARAFA